MKKFMMVAVSVLTLGSAAYAEFVPVDPSTPVELKKFDGSYSQTELTPNCPPDLVIVADEKARTLDVQGHKKIRSINSYKFNAQLAFEDGSTDWYTLAAVQSGSSVVESWTPWNKKPRELFTGFFSIEILPNDRIQTKVKEIGNPDTLVCDYSKK